MKGLTLSRNYFEAYGKPMLAGLERRYPALQGQLAAGLAGQGSECLGYDDALSADHDFGPSFCIWLPEALFKEYGQICQEAYDCLPGEFEGYPARKTTAFGQDRVGVLEIGAFYYRLIGREDAPKSNAEWMWLSESRLSQAVSGEVFLDEPGIFSSVRNALLDYYPEDVRKKKIAARAAAMAQSGQYNYSRLCQRGEWSGAFLAMEEFIKNTCSMVNLLNKTYTPFYKWMHRSLKDAGRLPQVYGLIDQLTDSFDSRTAWRTAVPEDFLFGIINKKDTRAVLIETICQLVIRELAAQGLSDAEDMYLEAHALSVMKKIQDPAIASLQLLEG